MMNFDTLLKKAQTFADDVADGIGKKVGEYPKVVAAMDSVSDHPVVTRASALFEEIDGTVNSIPLVKKINNIPLLRAFNNSKFNRFVGSKTGRMLTVAGFIAEAPLALGLAIATYSGPAALEVGDKIQGDVAGESSETKTIEATEVSVDMTDAASWMQDSVARESIVKEIDAIDIELAKRGENVEKFDIVFNSGEEIAAQSVAFLPNKMTVTVTFQEKRKSFQSDVYFSNPSSEFEIDNAWNNLLPNTLDENNPHEWTLDGAAAMVGENSNANLGSELLVSIKGDLYNLIPLKKLPPAGTVIHYPPGTTIEIDPVVDEALK